MHDDRHAVDARLADRRVGWLAARLAEPMPRGSVLLHAPCARLPGARRRREPARPDGPAPRRRSACAVRPFSPWTDRLEDARLLHLFGMSREGLELARVARARGVPVVLSPICWFEPRALAALATGAGRGGSATWPSGPFKRVVPALAELAARPASAWPTPILPNSRAEARAARPALRRRPERGFTSSPTASSRGSPTADARPLPRPVTATSDFVLYVGRIEPRKNVLGLVERGRALGPAAGRDRRRRRRATRRTSGDCRAAGAGSVRWLRAVDHDDPLLASAYAAARVFALPSWFETPGLAALEAALAGAAVVVTPYGCTREYFGDRVEYARPDRTGELARALDASLGRRARPAARARTSAQRFLWSDVARRTAEVYDQVAG